MDTSMNANSNSNASVAPSDLESEIAASFRALSERVTTMGVELTNISLAFKNRDLEWDLFKDSM
jgi:hypothetical protein